jgi:hypothetical protein
MPEAYSPYDVFGQGDFQDSDTVTSDEKMTTKHAQRISSEEHNYKADPIFNFLSCTAHTCTLATIVCFFIFVYWLSMLYFLPIVRKADELADKAILLVDDASSQLVFVDEARSKLVFFESMAVNISDLARINNNRAAGLEVEMQTSLSSVNLLSNEAQQTVLESNKLIANSADFLSTTSKTTNATLLKVSDTVNNIEDMTIQVLSQVNKTAAGLEVEIKTSLTNVNLLTNEAQQVVLQSNKLVAESADFLETTSKATNATLLKVSDTLNNVEDMSIQLLSQVNKTFTQRNADLMTIIQDAQTIIQELNKTLSDFKKSNEAVSQEVPTESVESYNPPE